MSDPLLGGDRHQLGEYLRDMANLMGLRDWVVRLQEGNPDDDEHAACAQMVYGRKVIGIQFRDGWEEWDPRELRQTVAHELLHAHINPLAFNTLNQFGPIISKRAYRSAGKT
jgi:Fe-S-cluster formation regulator IscX/YfhJ